MDCGDVCIEDRGTTFRAGLWPETDPEHLEFLLPLGTIEDESDVSVLRDIANRMHCRHKAATVLVLYDGGIVVPSILLVAGPRRMPTSEQITDVLPRACWLLSRDTSMGVSGGTG